MHFCTHLLQPRAAMMEKAPSSCVMGGVFPWTPWPFAAPAMSACVCQPVAALLSQSPWGCPTAPYGAGKGVSAAAAGTAEGLWGFHGTARPGCPCPQGWFWIADPNPETDNSRPPWIIWHESEKLVSALVEGPLTALLLITASLCSE